MEYIVKAMGYKVVATKFERMGVAAIHAKPAMETSAGEMMRIMRLNFDSQGRRGGGSWRADTVEWLSRKVKAGLDPRIGHATKALRDSMSIPGAAHQILAITDTSVNLGSSLSYAGYMNRDRPFAKFTEGDRMRLRGIIRDYLMAAYRA